MKTRFVTALLLICLALSLCACDPQTGSSTLPKNETTQAPKTEAPKTTVPETTAATSAPETQAPDTAAVTTEATEIAPSTTVRPSEERPTEPDVEASIRGTYVDDAYVNEVLKLRIAKPEWWISYSDEQIAQANNMSYEMFKETDVGDLVKKAGQLMDMMMSDVSGNNMNLIIQPSNALLNNYTDEQVFALSEETYKAQFKASGMELTTYEPLTMQVGGKDHTVLHLTLNVNGVEANEYQIWLRDSADYMGILTITIVTDIDPQPILDGITTLE